MATASEAVLLRAAEADDVPALVDYAKLAFREAYIAFDDAQEIDDYLATHFTADYFTTAISSEKQDLAVLTDDGQLLGYVLTQEGDAPAFVDSARPLELSRLYLRQRDVGRGLGRRLMQHAFALAEQGGFDCIWLLVYRKNQAAIDFYRRFGFVEQGVIDFWFGGRPYKDPVLVADVTQA